VNSYGFKGREVTRPKIPGTFRIVFLGNSCTYQGFPHMIELILRMDRPQVECLNFAIPGYTSYQGKVIVQTFIDEIDPDLVVASYGWNDRWLAYGQVDEKKQVTLSSGRAAEVLRGVYGRWRLLQYLRKNLSPKSSRSEPLDVSRVPIGQFRINLRTIGAECSKRGIPVVFATEPTSHFVLGVPDYVTESNFAKSKEASLELVREYNDAIRQITQEEESWHLVDLDSLISQRRDVREIFTGDGLHFSQSGLALVAAIEARFIADHILTGDR
jgi:lysophospholipase L1-like esterase